MKTFGNLFGIVVFIGAWAAVGRVLSWEQTIAVMACLAYIKLPMPPIDWD